MPAFGLAVAAIIAARLLVVVLGGVAGVFDTGPSQPPLAMLAALAVPVATFALAYALSQRFRGFALALDLRMLTAVQAWRVIGGMFIVLWAFDLQPALFPGENPGQWASMGALPLSLVPTFAVPLWIILHLISLLQLRQARRQAA